MTKLRTSHRCRVAAVGCRLSAVGQRAAATTALLGFCLLLLAGATARAEQSAAVLHLANGDFLTGQLSDSDAPDSLRWQSTVATSPFEFRVLHVSAVHFPPSENPQTPVGDYCFELSGGDRLFGELIEVTAEKIVVNSPPMGTLHLDRQHVGRIIRRTAVRDWTYVGPNGLAGWEQPDNASHWREEAGHLISDVPAASVRLECDIPELACIELQVSWKETPDFILAVGANLEPDPKKKTIFPAANIGLAVGQKNRTVSRTTGYRFEVWEKSLVVVRESEDDADVEFATLLDAEEGRIHLRAYLDQKSGRLSVYSLEGKRLAQIEVPLSESLAGVELSNKRGDVRLELLAINSWDGRLPVEVSLDEPNVQRTDGSVVYGEVTEFDSTTQQFVVAGKSGEQPINAADVTTLLISPQPETSIAPLRAALHNGASITGSLTAVREGQLHLSRDGIEQTITLPISAVRSLLGSGRDTLSPPEGVRVGRLELEGVRSHGWLVDGPSDSGGSCLVWQPRQSTTSGPLTAALSGRLVYRDPPPPPRPKVTQPQQPQRPPARPGVWGGMLDAFGVRQDQKPNPQPESAPQAISTKSLLYLRTGDNIPCEVTRIDEVGVHIASSVAEATLVPHDRVKAIALSADAKLPELDEKKRQRLLTLPRMQRHNPPTHLIFATNGDILRGRLEEMNDAHVAVEIHLETRDLPRQQVASIIWLHDAESTVDTPSKPPIDSAGMLIHALRPDGIRLTFVPHEVSDNTLVGASDILGACRVDLRTVDMLLLGDMIQTAADEQEFHTWKLAHAIDPRHLQEESQDGARAATPTSGLVGQPAPDFGLNLLTGKPFRLSEQKGQVVVLDFWASWCGPCMQAMPLVDEVVQEFEDQGVKLVTVNMQEDQATIEGALERLKLESLVVLDIDGATSEKYEVTAIPQTVVIDAQGKVAYLFVGGGSQLAEQLRQALETLTAKGE